MMRTGGKKVTQTVPGATPTVAPIETILDDTQVVAQELSSIDKIAISQGQVRSAMLMVVLLAR